MERKAEEDGGTKSKAEKTTSQRGRSDYEKRTPPAVKKSQIRYMR